MKRNFSSILGQRYWQKYYRVIFPFQGLFINYVEQDLNTGFYKVNRNVVQKVRSVRFKYGLPDQGYSATWWGGRSVEWNKYSYQRFLLGEYVGDIFSLHQWEKNYLNSLRRTMALKFEGRRAKGDTHRLYWVHIIGKIGQVIQQQRLYVRYTCIYKKLYRLRGFRDEKKSNKIFYWKICYQPKLLYQNTLVSHHHDNYYLRHNRYVIQRATLLILPIRFIKERTFRYLSIHNYFSEESKIAVAFIASSLNGTFVNQWSHKDGISRVYNDGAERYKFLGAIDESLALRIWLGSSQFLRQNEPQVFLRTCNEAIFRVGLPDLEIDKNGGYYYFPIYENEDETVRLAIAAMIASYLSRLKIVAKYTFIKSGKFRIRESFFIMLYKYYKTGLIGGLNIRHLPLNRAEKGEIGIRSSGLGERWDKYAKVRVFKKYIIGKNASVENLIFKNVSKVKKGAFALRKFVLRFRPFFEKKDYYYRWSWLYKFTKQVNKWSTEVRVADIWQECAFEIREITKKIVSLVITYWFKKFMGNIRCLTQDGKVRLQRRLRAKRVKAIVEKAENQFSDDNQVSRPWVYYGRLKWQRLEFNILSASLIKGMYRIRLHQTYSMTRKLLSLQNSGSFFIKGGVKQQVNEPNYVFDNGRLGVSSVEDIIKRLIWIMSKRWKFLKAGVRFTNDKTRLGNELFIRFKRWTINNKSRRRGLKKFKKNQVRYWGKVSRRYYKKARKWWSRYWQFRVAAVVVKPRRRHFNSKRSVRLRRMPTYAKLSILQIFKKLRRQYALGSCVKVQNILIQPNWTRVKVGEPFKNFYNEKQFYEVQKAVRPKAYWAKLETSKLGVGGKAILQKWFDIFKYQFLKNPVSRVFGFSLDEFSSSRLARFIVKKRVRRGVRLGVMGRNYQSLDRYSNLWRLKNAWFRENRQKSIWQRRVLRQGLLKYAGKLFIKPYLKIEQQDWRSAKRIFFVLKRNKIASLLTMRKKSPETVFFQIEEFAKAMALHKGKFFEDVFNTPDGWLNSKVRRKTLIRRRTFRRLYFMELKGKERLWHKSTENIEHKQCRISILSENVFHFDLWEDTVLNLRIKLGEALEYVTYAWGALLRQMDQPRYRQEKRHSRSPIRVFPMGRINSVLDSNYLKIWVKKQKSWDKGYFKFFNKFGGQILIVKKHLLKKFNKVHKAVIRHENWRTRYVQAIGSIRDPKGQWLLARKWGFSLQRWIHRFDVIQEYRLKKYIIEPSTLNNDNRDSEILLNKFKRLRGVWLDRILECISLRCRVKKIGWHNTKQQWRYLSSLVYQFNADENLTPEYMEVCRTSVARRKRNRYGWGYGKKDFLVGEFKRRKLAYLKKKFFFNKRRALRLTGRSLCFSSEWVRQRHATHKVQSRMKVYRLLVSKRQVDSTIGKLTGDSRAKLFFSKIGKSDTILAFLKKYRLKEQSGFGRGWQYKLKISQRRWPQWKFMNLIRVLRIISLKERIIYLSQYWRQVGLSKVLISGKRRGQPKLNRRWRSIFSAAGSVKVVPAKLITCDDEEGAITWKKIRVFKKRYYPRKIQVLIRRIGGWRDTKRVRFSTNNANRFSPILGRYGLYATSAYALMLTTVWSKFKLRGQRWGRSAVQISLDVLRRSGRNLVKCFKELIRAIRKAWPLESQHLFSLLAAKKSKLTVSTCYRIRKKLILGLNFKTVHYKRTYMFRKLWRSYKVYRSILAYVVIQLKLKKVYLELSENKYSYITGSKRSTEFKRKKLDYEKRLKTFKKIKFQGWGEFWYIKSFFRPGLLGLFEKKKFLPYWFKYKVQGRPSWRCWKKLIKVFKRLWLIPEDTVETRVTLKKGVTGPLKHKRLISSRFISLKKRCGRRLNRRLRRLYNENWKACGRLFKHLWVKVVKVHVGEVGQKICIKNGLCALNKVFFKFWMRKVGKINFNVKKVKQIKKRIKGYERRFKPFYLKNYTCTQLYNMFLKGLKGTCKGVDWNRIEDFIKDRRKVYYHLDIKK